MRLEWALLWEPNSWIPFWSASTTWLACSTARVMTLVSWKLNPIKTWLKNLMMLTSVYPSTSRAAPFLLGRRMLHRQPFPCHATPTSLEFKGPTGSTDLYASGFRKAAGIPKHHSAKEMQCVPTKKNLLSCSMGPRAESSFSPSLLSPSTRLFLGGRKWFS